MNDRYSRQSLFKPIGEAGQRKIGKKHVLIMGCGALGTANAETLVRAGIGKLTIIDRDYVEYSNLQRQQLFTEKDADNQVPKAIAAKKALNAINSNVIIDAYVMDVTGVSLEPLLVDVDLVIDATDNFDIRFTMNDLIHKSHIPWIFGSCVSSTGMSYTILPGETPCLYCLLNTTTLSGATCDSVGIIASAVQMVVAHQTTEALKLLVEDKRALRTKLVMFDLWTNQYHSINVDRAKKDGCPTCGTQPTYPYLSYEAQTKTEVLCGRNTVQIRSNREVLLNNLANRLKRLGKVNVNEFLLSIDYDAYRVVIFRDGRAFVHGTDSLEKAKKIYYQLVG
ncbi:thiamine biosynthesis protein MoeB [Oceanobacillus sp. 143]|uniref:Thiamine biosynthesis protein MoeB n=1 Tax=Oceanobacillus zhaokaii TaxID=2052660 RepID=A0A345PJZ9_9BACI|nr:MoeB/ThiF family adenylyltransferase [Oceanobacillus zhaokaii]AXI10329.1 thiamine biosynthesis protein MoeB [Oceanobacillus zhaokaii]QGS69377.1 thiamine biosynthesis protein MoeB [Oceanobacillus sp. 143]